MISHLSPANEDDTEMGLLARAQELPRSFASTARLLGPLQASRLCLVNAAALGDSRRAARLNRLHVLRLEERFDRLHGVDTARRSGEGPEGPRGLAADLGYQPTDWPSFRAAMRALDIDPVERVFIDFGSGRGKTLLLAAAYPFRQVVGVEYAGDLHEAAEANIDRFARAGGAVSPMECLCVDARDFRFPPEPLVVYLFNPFTDAILEPVLDNLEQSLRHRPRPVSVIYYHPKYRAALDRRPWLRPLGPERAMLQGGLQLYERRQLEQAT